MERAMFRMALRVIANAKLIPSNLVRQTYGFDGLNTTLRAYRDRQGEYQTYLGSSSFVIERHLDKGRIEICIDEDPINKDEGITYSLFVPISPWHKAEVRLIHIDYRPRLVPEIALQTGEYSLELDLQTPQCNRQAYRTQIKVYATLLQESLPEVLAAILKPIANGLMERRRNKLVKLLQIEPASN